MQTRVRTISSEPRSARGALSIALDPRAQRGRGATGLVAGAAIVCAVLVAALWIATRGQEPESGAHAAVATAHAESAPAQLSGPLEHDTSARANGLPDAPIPLAARGSIRGELVVRTGVTFPAAWTLVLEPSAVVSGRERGSARRIEFTHGEREFRVDDLPLAGYRVRPEAAGVNGLGQDVLLVPSSANVFVTLALARAGLLDGLVREASGAPAEGVTVTLENTLGGERTKARTDANGMYVLTDVVDGEYRVWIGTPESPLAPAIDISFRAPSLRVPERKLPALGGLDLVVFDEGDGYPRAGGARVWGATSAGGAFDVVADAAGAVSLRHLLPGTWRVEASLGTRASGSVEFEILAERTTESQLKLRPE